MANDDNSTRLRRRRAVTTQHVEGEGLGPFLPGILARTTSDQHSGTCVCRSRGIGRCLSETLRRPATTRRDSDGEDQRRLRADQGGSGDAGRRPFDAHRPLGATPSMPLWSTGRQAEIRGRAVWSSAGRDGERTWWPPVKESLERRHGLSIHVPRSCLERPRAVQCTFVARHVLRFCARVRMRCHARLFRP